VLSDPRPRCTFAGQDSWAGHGRGECRPIQPGENVFRDIDEIATRRVIIANSNTTYALADASKLGSVAPHHVCRLEEVTAVITDREPKPEMDAAIRHAGGRAIYPD
jgi:DeoR/GlpR family transcriptional regulator of sugar metabolism